MSVRRSASGERASPFFANRAATKASMGLAAPARRTPPATAVVALLARAVAGTAGFVTGLKDQWAAGGDFAVSTPALPITGTKPSRTSNQTIINSHHPAGNTGPPSIPPI